jgi:Uma2 family endonuclease
MSILAPVLSVPPRPARPLTVAGYERLVAMGLLTEDDRVELLEGWIFPKMPANPPHDGTIDLVDDALRPLLPAGHRLRLQERMTTPDSVPEPDVAVVRGNARSFVQRHPGPADVPLVVEVADSSLESDREDKGRLYARASVAVYWIVNLIDRQVEVYTDPSGPADEPSYGTRQDFLPGQDVPLVLDGVVVGQVPVNDLLP